MTTQADSAGRPPQPPEGQQALSHRQILLVFSGLMLGMLLAALDQTIVATALPRIVADLQGLEHLSWVVTAYLLTSTASTPLYGKISDLYGRKVVFQFAIGVFLVGSMLAGLSQNMGELIAFRAVQGMGAGGLMTIAMAIVGDVVSPRERGRYQGYFGALFGLSSVAGPLIGGYLTESHHLLVATTSWRWIFYINVPLGIVAFVVVQAVLRISFVRHEHRIDYSGATLLVTGVTTLLLVTVWGGKAGEGGYAWGSWQIVTLLLAGIALLVAFTVREHYAPEPILPLRLFRNSVFTVANVVGFVVGLAMFGAIVYLPLYLQLIRGASPTASGLLLTPMMFGVIFASVLSGRLISRLGRYKAFPILGTALMTVGFWLMSHLGADTTRTVVSLYMLVVGLGVGFTLQVLVLAMQNSVEHRDLGVVTSSGNFFRSMGGSFGTALFGAILTGQLRGYVDTHLPASPTGGRPVQLGNLTGGALKALHAKAPQVADTITVGFVHALHVVFLTAVPFAAVAFAASLFLKEIRLRDRAHVTEQMSAMPEATTPEVVS
jgi:EmrB/QacA subfamily drug resistance transporter